MCKSNLTQTDIKYLDVESNFFKSTRPKTAWWSVAIVFFAFLALAILSAILIYKGFAIVIDSTCPDNFLLFFFVILVLLLVSMVLLAYFMVKVSTKHRSEMNERENKKLAFRLKMMESVFELENRQIIIEKQEKEKTIAREEKQKLYELDEQQRAAEHQRKMELREFELVENYMKYVIELAKIKENKKGSLIHLGDDFEISMVNPIAKIEKVPENGDEKEYYKISFEKNS